MKTVAILGTFDSKGNEFLYVKELFESLGLKTFTIHCGVFDPLFKPDVSNEEVLKSSGFSLFEITEKKDRAFATEALSKGIEKLLPKLYEDGNFQGVISFGGSGGTSIATSGMKALPIGVPKIMVSTIASGNTTQYVGTSDIIMFPSIVDVAGINLISEKVFSNAVFAMCGMLSFESKKETPKKPLIAATMFGVTTPCIDYARKYLENKGYEVIVFHATGIGGKTMESLIESGFFEGVLDITTTEWCDELFGGVLSAGPNRLEAAGKYGVPQVVSLGALDMVNFGPMDTVPKEFLNRNLYKHNLAVTLMRTTVEENAKLGEIIAKQLNKAKGKTSLMIPLKGVSMIDDVGLAFYGPKEDEALFNAIRQNIDLKLVKVYELDKHINDEEFAKEACDRLIELMENK